MSDATDEDSAAIAAYREKRGEGPFIAADDAREAGWRRPDASLAPSDFLAGHHDILRTFGLIGEGNGP